MDITACISFMFLHACGHGTRTGSLHRLACVGLWLQRDTIPAALYFSNEETGGLEDPT